MHMSSEEFEIRRDSTTDSGVSCPLASEKNPHRLIMGKTVLPFFRLFLIGSFSYLQITMTYIRAWMSSKFAQIRFRTTELPDIDLLTIDVATFFSAVFHPIPLVLAGHDDMHKSSKEFEIRRDSTTDCRVSCH